MVAVVENDPAFPDSVLVVTVLVLVIPLPIMLIDLPFIPAFPASVSFSVPDIVIVLFHREFGIGLRYSAT